MDCSKRLIGGGGEGGGGGGEWVEGVIHIQRGEGLTDDMRCVGKRCAKGLVVEHLWYKTV